MGVRQRRQLLRRAAVLGRLSGNGPWYQGLARGSAPGAPPRTRPSGDPAGLIAEQMVRLRPRLRRGELRCWELRCGRVRRRGRVGRRGRYHPGREQAEQGEAGGDKHRYCSAVIGRAVDGDQRRGHDRHAERRAALSGGGQQRAGRALGPGGDDNDGRFPDGSRVEVRYPRTRGEHGDRAAWPWLPGTITGQCGPDEWQVCVEDRAVAVLRDGRPAPRNTASRNLYYPLCFRDSSEIRRPAPAVPKPGVPALRVDATPAVRRPTAAAVRRGRSR